ncbi:hypothetical protein QYF36_025807 [Acer negundo]|nr:hypothetical protein QYF36_025807 [Acer negundo]
MSLFRCVLDMFFVAKHHRIKSSTNSQFGRSEKRCRISYLKIISCFGWRMITSLSSYLKAERKSRRECFVAFYEVGNPVF